ncbi:hypothetical protein [Nostoc sp.]|uniref:hypothetical protein n=1 Tax=Nostoc sp. TaxID=1180 RepID=UPI003FA53DD0
MIYTPEEWETVVDQIKQSNDQELSESQLEAVSGGIMSQAMYGIVVSPVIPLNGELS